MDHLAILIFALLLAMLLLVAWRARALTFLEARRVRDAAIRAQELRQIAADATNLLAATELTLYSARAALDNDDLDDLSETIDDATRALRALGRLFHASRAYARYEIDGPPHPLLDGEHRLEGAARVAVAVTRSRGPGVGLIGDTSELRHESHVASACHLLVALIERGRATLSGTEYVQVRLEPSTIEIVAGSSGDLSIESLENDARALGLRLKLTRIEGRSAVVVDSLPDVTRAERRRARESALSGAT